MKAKKLKLRREVAAFAQAMEMKLRANDHKGGWQNMSPSWLIDRLREETTELKKVAERAQFWGDDDPGLRTQAMMEAADVANFAMMVADVVGGLVRT